VPRLTLSNIWSELGPISTDKAVFVHTPRSGSIAAEAGLLHRDIIQAADEHELESHFSLQEIIKSHNSAESIVLQVLRGSDEPENITITLP